jgi:hypothetical protein
MLNPNMNYPYPLVRTHEEDYRSTIFKGELTVNLQPDCYLVRPAFEINNPGIAELIEAGKLTYAIEIQSPATWYRHLFQVKDNKPIRLDTASLHERVELTPCIIATAQIAGFTNDDFEEEYQGMTFEINAGDVIAIGEVRTFDALYQDDVIKNGTSPVTITRSDTAKEISCDFSGSLIEITLPGDQHDRYIECGYKAEKYKTLNAILSIPALVEGISIIANDVKNPDHTSGLEKKAWYKTIVVNLKRAAENNEGKYRALLDKPFASAELLLGNNYSSALQYLSLVELN